MHHFCLFFNTVPTFKNSLNTWMWPKWVLFTHNKYCLLEHKIIGWMKCLIWISRAKGAVRAVVTRETARRISSLVSSSESSSFLWCRPASCSDSGLGFRFRKDTVVLLCTLGVWSWCPSQAEAAVISLTDWSLRVCSNEKTGSAGTFSQFQCCCYDCACYCCRISVP